MNTFAHSFRIFNDVFSTARERYIVDWTVAYKAMDFISLNRVKIQSSAPYLVTWTESKLTPNGWQDKVKTAKFGRWMTAQLAPNTSIELTDHQIEQIVNLYKAQFEVDDLRIELVTGEEIRHYYHEENYANRDRTGDLANSCMRYSECQGYLDIYVENPDNVALLVALDEEDRTVARSIIWTDNHGIQYQDRIYGTQVAQEIMRSWAEERGIGNAADGNTSITLKRADFYQYPYADTFNYLNVNKRIIANYGISGAGTLTSTGGDLEGMASCDACGESLDEESAYSNDWHTYCHDCYYERYACCDHCEEDTDRDDITYVENGDVSLCSYCYSHNVNHCDGCDGAFYRDYCEDCVEEEEEEEVEFQLALTF